MEKILITCYTKRNFKAIDAAIDQCRIDKVFKEIVRIDKDAKGKRFLVEFKPDPFGHLCGDEFHILCNLPVGKEDVHYDMWKAS